MELISRLGLLESPARTRPPERGALRIGAVQIAWRPDPVEHVAVLNQGIALAAAQGAELVCLQELTLSPYFAISPDGPGSPGSPQPEELPGGPTHAFAAEAAATHGVVVHASLWERAPDGGTPGSPPGYNTAIAVAPDGRLLARTRKLHIPVTAGYHEDRWFRAGPADGGGEREGDGDGDSAGPYPVVELGRARVGLPTCWDQWFPEPARAYSLAGADLVVYPTAIGSEPDHPGFDTQPLWQQVIVANGIANGLTMVAVNRTGTESAPTPGGSAPASAITFYGSSFVSDCYGRVLVEAPRSGDATLVADVDLDARRDWLELFPFLATRRPDTYGGLVE